MGQGKGRGGVGQRSDLSFLSRPVAGACDFASSFGRIRSYLQPLCGGKGSQGLSRPPATSVANLKYVAKLQSVNEHNVKATKEERGRRGEEGGREGHQPERETTLWLRGQGDAPGDIKQPRAAHCVFCSF